MAGYGDSLAGRLSRAGSIMADLRGRGFDVVVAPGARVHHANPSRLASSALLRFDAGRLFGAGKVRAERWPAWRRAGYAALWPVIPFLRWASIRPKLAVAGRRHAPALALGLVLDAAGQGLGFALGPGGAGRRLQAFEIGRLRHLARRDRAAMTGDRLPFDDTPATR